MHLDPTGHDQLVNVSFIMQFNVLVQTSLDSCEVLIDTGLEVGNISNPSTALCTVGARSDFISLSSNGIADLTSSVVAQACAASTAQSEVDVSAVLTVRPPALFLFLVASLPAPLSIWKHCFSACLMLICA